MPSKNFNVLFRFHGQEKRNLSVQVGCWAEGVRPTDLTALGIPCFGPREETEFVHFLRNFKCFSQTFT